MHLAFVVVAVVFCLLAGPTAQAGETDPHYAWLHPPNDATAALNDAIAGEMAVGLSAANERADRASLTCRDAAAAMTARLSQTAHWFFLSSLAGWGVPRSPGNSSEYFGRFREESTYRYAALLPFGSFVPLDPAVAVNGVLFGTDKIGHFFTAGLRYYDRYTNERQRGATHEDAERAALLVGIGEESGVLGRCASGIFSYADLEANYQGLRFYQQLCDGSDGSDGSAPQLAFVGDNAASQRWRLILPFDLARFVTPCWDESFYPSAYGDLDRDAVRRAMRGYCARWRTPVVQKRRALYRQRGCQSFSVAALREMISKHTTPDPSPFAIDELCHKAGAPEAKAEEKPSPGQPDTVGPGASFSIQPVGR